MLIVIGALLVSAIFPFVIYFFLRNAHQDSAVCRKDCRKLFLSGLLLGFPVFGLSFLCSILFSLTHISDKYPFAKAVFSAFVLKAFSEELMKYFLAKRIIEKNRATVSFLDLMACAAISAIGFEIMEGIFYAFSSNVPQILVRGIPCMHAAFGLVMGFFLALGIRKNGKVSMIPAVVISTLIHGTYDLCLDETISETDWGLLALLLALLSLVLNVYSFSFMKKARKKEYYSEPLFPGDPEAAGPCA